MDCLAVPMPTNSEWAVDCAVKMDDIDWSVWQDCWANACACSVSLWLAFVRHCAERRRRPECVRPNRFSSADTMLCHSFEINPIRISANRIRVRKTVGIWQRHHDSRFADPATAGTAIVLSIRPTAMAVPDIATEIRSPICLVVVVRLMAAEESVTSSFYINLQINEKQKRLIMRALMQLKTTTDCERLKRCRRSHMHARETISGLSGFERKLLISCEPSLRYHFSLSSFSMQNNDACSPSCSTEFCSRDDVVWVPLHRWDANTQRINE